MQIKFFLGKISGVPTECNSNFMHFLYEKTIDLAWIFLHHEENRLGSYTICVFVR